MRHFLIQGEFDTKDGEFLYWSNKDGWVDFELATLFGTDELYDIHFPVDVTPKIALLQDNNKSRQEVLTMEEAFARFCPEITHEVIIQVRGGVAEVVKKAKGVKLTIIDWDNATIPEDDPDGDEIPSEEIHEVNEDIEWIVN